MWWTTVLLTIQFSNVFCLHKKLVGTMNQKWLTKSGQPEMEFSGDRIWSTTFGAPIWMITKCWRCFSCPHLNKIAINQFFELIDGSASCSPFKKSCLCHTNLDQVFSRNSAVFAVLKSMFSFLVQKTFTIECSDLSQKQADVCASFSHQFHTNQLLPLPRPQKMNGSI